MQAQSTKAPHDVSAEFRLLDELFDTLFPLLRSITGPGVRETLRLLQAHMPLEIGRVSSGTRVLNWTVPPEWSCTAAELRGPNGELIVSLEQSNLHVLNYSMPVDEQLDLDSLQANLYSLPHLPAAVPYVTSYYKPRWGFCLSQQQRDQLRPGRYHARIEAEHDPAGELNWGDVVLPGETTDEVLISSYICHPSLANNELSGPLTAVALFRRLAAWPRRRFTYRFVLLPETIGSISYLHQHGAHLRKHVVGGIVLTCLGGPGTLSYKTSRRTDSPLDRLVSYLHASEEQALRIRPFTPTDGSDERQYCSPGFNLPVGQFARAVYGDYDGYHNSLDTKAFMTIEALVQAADQIESILRHHEVEGYYVNRQPYGEVKLDQHQLYPDLNSHDTALHSNNILADSRRMLNAVLTVLNYADGQHSVVELAQRCGIRFDETAQVIGLLQSRGLLDGPFPLPTPLPPLP